MHCTTVLIVAYRAADPQSLVHKQLLNVHGRDFGGAFSDTRPLSGSESVLIFAPTVPGAPNTSVNVGWPALQIEQAPIGGSLRHVRRWASAVGTRCALDTAFCDGLPFPH